MLRGSGMSAGSGIWEVNPAKAAAAMLSLIGNGMSSTYKQTKNIDTKWPYELMQLNNQND